MRVIGVLTIVAILALPAAAEVEVTHDTEIDFGHYQTYAWRPGTDAARPEVQRWIVNAVEHELEADGLRVVSDRKADLYVATHVFKEIDSQTRAGYIHLHRIDVSVITSGIAVTTKGVLVIDLIDGESEQSVWRGLASDLMAPPSPNKLRKKIEKAVRKLLGDYPPH